MPDQELLLSVYGCQNKNYSCQFVDARSRITAVSLLMPDREMQFVDSTYIYIIIVQSFVPFQEAT